jgi:hypothetical protein
LRNTLKALVCITLVALLSACGGNDDEDERSSGDSGASIPSTSTTSSPTVSATTAPSGSPDNAGPATSATGASTSNGETPHACTFLTPDEVNELLGDEVGAAEGRDYLATNINATQCEWGLQGGALYVEILGSGASAWFDAVNFGNTNPPIDGIGDMAVIGPGGTLDVLQGDYMVSVQLVLFGSGIDKEAAARDVAAKILSKL